MSLSRKRLFLAGYFGAPNFGDELVISAAITGIWENRPGFSFEVGCASPRTAYRNSLVRENVTFVHSGYPKRGLSIREKVRLLYGLLRADFLLFPGGGIVQDVHSCRLLEHCCSLVALASLLGKPSMCSGIGVGPVVSERGKMLASFLINSMGIIGVRDAFSLDCASSLSAPFSSGGEGQRIFCGADTVFSLDLSSLRKPRGDKLISLFFREWEDLPVSRVARLVNEIHRRGYSSRFVCCERSDWAFCERINDLVDCQVTIDAVGDVKKSIETISQSYCVISMRLHPLIVAMKMGIPALAISYDSKVSEVMKACGLSRQTVDLDFSPSVLSDLIASSKCPPENAVRDLSNSSRHALEQVLEFSESGKMKPRISKLAALVFLRRMGGLLL